MSRAKPKARRPSARKSGASAARSIRTLPWKPIGLLALWGLTLGAGAYGLQVIEDGAHALNHADGRWAIEWVDPPAWLADIPDFDQRDVETTLGSLQHVPLRDPDLGVGIAEALQTSPWIAAVNEVRKRSDGVIRVRATFRRPLTMIEFGHTGYLVDDEGVLLPRFISLDYRRPDHGVFLRGVQASPPTTPGTRWEGEDVQAGLKLVKYLHEKTPALLRSEFRAVDVSNVGGRRSPLAAPLRIITIHPGSYIEWGRAPGEEYDMEARADAKLAKLWVLHAELRSLPNNGPLDVRDADNRIHLEPQAD